MWVYIHSPSHAIKVIKMSANIMLSNAAFPGAAADTGVYTLTHNITLTSPNYPDASYTDWYPTFDTTNACR